MKTFIASLAAVLLLVLPGAARADTVTVKGSDTMVILVQRWAEEFMKKNPNVKLQVTGGGSGTGLSALINGTTDIAMASRPMKKAEGDQLRKRFKNDATEISVAKDGVTFYVNEKNPLDALTQEQLKGIYLGDITNWKEVGGPDAPIIVYSRENSSGTYVFVKDNLLDGEDYAARAQTLPGTAAVVNAVSKEKNGIGYGGAAYAKGIKELKVKKDNEAIAPTEANIKSGKYPLARDLYFYLRNKPDGDAKAFIDFVLSPEGQAVVTKVGYFPVK
ncbi:phosphate ABC transporter substrate-binding protein [Archangium violaceum]|uniref:phosphate ABC transporter substrate-binding protein n=1 Tax=Archangium violaceum TaxID=83451 RepID=UPI00193B0FA8|nr:phosphate ABC transporter substrate-binding protein [Archangium violaceum]QRK05290.1 phosphate ABC transporter substrate-binding protein [Archangium violaceum]